MILDSLHWCLYISVIQTSLPDFIDLLSETVFHQSVLFGFLGVSAGDILGQVGPAVEIYF